MEDIEKLVAEKITQITDSLKNGKSVEIHLSKDGIRVYEVKKKTLK